MNEKAERPMQSEYQIKPDTEDLAVEDRVHPDRNSTPIREHREYNCTKRSIQIPVSHRIARAVHYLAVEFPESE